MQKKKTAAAQKNRVDARQEKYVKMTTAPVERLILKLSVPTIASLLVTAAYNLADTYFVSTIGGAEGTVAIAAVSAALAVMTLLQALGFFIGQGSANFISRALGRKDVEKASEMAATGVLCILIVGVTVGALGLIFVRQIAGLLTNVEAVVPVLAQYLRWIFLAAPLMTCSFCLNNQLRFQGNAVYAMIGVVCGAVLNVGLDPLFIHGFGMGAEGAALATAISQSVSFLVLLRGTFRGDNLRIHLRRARLSAENLAWIVKGGLPSLMRQGCASISVLALNRVAGELGDSLPAVGGAVLMAAFGLVSKVVLMANYVVIGFGQGYQPVCGFNYGAGKYARVRQAFRFLVLITAGWCLLFTAAGELLAPHIVNLFPDAEPAVRALAQTILRFQCVTFLVNCWVVPSNMTQQTMGKTVSASVLAMARQGMFLVPLVLVLPRLFGLLGLELCQPISDVLALCLALPLQLRVLRQLRAPDREVAP